MDVSKITVGGKAVNKNFYKFANPQKVGHLIKESIGLEIGTTRIEAERGEPFYILKSLDAIYNGALEKNIDCLIKRLKKISRQET